VDWDPNLGVIQSDPTSGDGYNISDLYDDDEATEDAIRNLSNDRLRSVDNLIFRDIVSTLTDFLS
jgi:hypothetical protein